MATQGWQKLCDENDSLEAVDRLVEHFSFPLLKANARVEAIHSEFESMFEYAYQYITLESGGGCFMLQSHQNGEMH